MRRIAPSAGSTAVVANVVALLCAGCATHPSQRVDPAAARVPAYNRAYSVEGRRYTPAASPDYDEVGTASWYVYPGRTTSDGERFTPSAATAAHRTLPIPAWIEVTNLENGRRARLRLNDRGPFREGRLIDVSRAAARELGFVEQGTARVRVRWIGPAAPLGHERAASTTLAARD